VDGEIIEVRVRDLNQLFDSLDPSPFHEKDLDRRAEEYIVSSARELPGRAPPTLVVHLDRAPGGPDEPEVLRDAIRSHFVRAAELSRRELRQLMRRGWISLAIGLTVLAAALVGGEVASRLAEEPWATLAQESLLIGGWVAMWRPMEILLYDWWIVRGERRVYDRVGRMEVRILHTQAKRTSLSKTYSV
jgi:hypothetical protein